MQYWLRRTVFLVSNRLSLTSWVLRPRGPDKQLQIRTHVNTSTLPRPGWGAGFFPPRSGGVPRWRNSKSQILNQKCESGAVRLRQTGGLAMSVHHGRAFFTGATHRSVQRVESEYGDSIGRFRFSLPAIRRGPPATTKRGPPRTHLDSRFRGNDRRGAGHFLPGV